MSLKIPLHKQNTNLQDVNSPLYGVTSSETDSLPFVEIEPVIKTRKFNLFKASTSYLFPRNTLALQYTTYQFSICCFHLFIFAEYTGWPWIMQPLTALDCILLEVEELSMIKIYRYR